MLDNLDKNKKPFKVPENYFQDFNAEIMGKLPVKENVTVKRIPLWKKVVPWTAVAAAFIGVLFLTGIFDRGASVDPTAVMSQNNDQTDNSSFVLSEEEDIYYAFIEDEIVKARYKEMMLN